MTDARLVRAYVGSLGLLAFAGTWAAVAGDRPALPAGGTSATATPLERREQALLDAVAAIEEAPAATGVSARIVPDAPVTATRSS